MPKEYIIQLRDNSRAIINAKIINCMIADDNITQETLIKTGYADISLFLGNTERVFIYEIEDEIDYKYYCEDAERIRFALNKLGGNL